MTSLDRFIQNWRLRVGLRCLEGEPLRVIDVGAHQGECFVALGDRLQAGFGIEPLAKTSTKTTHFEIQPGFFPAVRPAEGEWDAITLFAVLEHIPRSEHLALADACFDLLRVGGRIIITVPSAMVDSILWVLKSLRLIDGMSLEEHFGFEAAETVNVFPPPRFRLVQHQRFQMGLNHLFVFEKKPSSADVK
jgi:hypothetical protein